MNSPEICTEIVKCLGIVWTDKMFLDFTIKIHDDTITCHKLVLAACSEFFQALFRSGMREVKENCVVLKDVSYEIFQLILKTLYTGVNVLTLDNFIHVWRAVHMLQINFMVKMCERFAIASITLDNWEYIYTTSKLLGSTIVLESLHRFMLQNFDQISLSSTYLQLPFSDIRDLIKSQDLAASSEDIVLESVIRWVGCCTPNNKYSLVKSRKIVFGVGEESNELEKTHSDITIDIAKNVIVSRKDNLTELIQLVRTYLVSPSVLSRVYQHELCSENKDFRDIIVSALSYHAHPTRDGLWPSAAVHRSSSSYTHVGVYVKRYGQFRAISACDEKWYGLSTCDELKDSIQLVTYDGELYASGKSLNQPDGHCKLFVFSENTWKEIFKLPGYNLLLVSHGQFIYLLNKDDNAIYNINPKSLNIKMCTQFSMNVEVKHMTVFENSLLLFCSETHNQIDETAIHKFDLLSKVWMKLENLDGPAEQVISFRNDKYSFILQTNGCLWVILHAASSQSIGRKFVSKLWNCQKKLHGALVYNDKLIVFGNGSSRDPPDANRRESVPGYIETIKHWGHEATCSNFVPVTLLKSCLFQPTNSNNTK
ncbi:kelch-like protein 41 [Physella acuta]|uniref:kelch-like protein 41 n=1 Tax=Physella acuta TaxID=109671 RepID=UPI0027DAB703|nr:kelch-like protein 41 [Physella acuta]